MNPSAQAPKKTEKQFREELDALTRQGAQLNERRIRIESEVERARREKEELEASLTKEFGTCDLEKLAEMLAERERANEEALSQYREGIAKLSQEIKSVSEKLEQAK